MTANIPGNLSASCGVSDVDRFFEIKLRRKLREIVCVSVHLVAVKRLGRSSVAATIVSDASKSARGEIEDLAIPVIRTQRPTVAKHNGLPRSKILVEDLRSVRGRDKRHFFLLVVAKSDERRTSPAMSDPRMINVLCGKYMRRALGCQGNQGICAIIVSDRPITFR